jgi:transcriptional regulator with XRE-family HTH domain
MAKPFRELIKDVPAERRERIGAQTEALVVEYEVIKALRADCKVTQQELAALMGIRQASLSKIENQSDIHLATLRKYIEALGGQLEIRANFPDRSVTIQQFTISTTPAARMEHREFS